MHRHDNSIRMAGCLRTDGLRTKGSGDERWCRLHASATVLTIFLVPAPCVAGFRVEKQAGMAEHRVPAESALAS